MNYKKIIIELLDRIDCDWFLKRVYVSLREYIKESRALELVEVLMNE